MLNRHDFLGLKNFFFKIRMSPPSIRKIEQQGFKKKRTSFLYIEQKETFSIGLNLNEVFEILFIDVFCWQQPAQASFNWFCLKKLFVVKNQTIKLFFIPGKPREHLLNAYCYVEIRLTSFVLKYRTFSSMNHMLTTRHTFQLFVNGNYSCFFFLSFFLWSRSRIVITVIVKTAFGQSRSNQLLASLRVIETKLETASI